MLTRCPDCGTTFRVTPDQLKARSGRVRCGACQHVFNALETLAEEKRPTAATGAEETPVPHEQLRDEASGASETPEAPEQVPAAAEEEAAVEDEAAVAEEEARAAEEEARAAEEEVHALEADTAVEDEAVPTDEAVPARDENEEVHAAEEHAIADESAADVAETDEPAAPSLAEEPAEPEPGSQAEQQRRAPNWPWLAGSIAASLFLAVQAVLHFRTEIAVLHPDTRPLLAAACDMLGCELLRPRKPELVGIEASDLAIAADGRLALTATLRNRAPFAQEYPHLELTLTDTADKALVRRVLAPADYLPAQTPPAQGFGARGEVAINLAVAASGIAAAGYRLYLFYP